MAPCGPETDTNDEGLSVKNLKKSWLLMLLGAPFFGGKVDAKASGPHVSPAPPIPDDPVDLRPLNRPSDNLFAGHRSHSSHASHRSSSGGGYVAPRPAPAPAPAPAPRTPAPSGPKESSSGAPGPARGVVSPGAAQPTDPGRAEAVSPIPGQPKQPTLSVTEKRTLQIMRVQIALTSLGVYTGTINGVLDSETKESLKRFQIVKGLESNGLMTTETLNALGVPAVQ